MFKRHILSDVNHYLQHFPALLITGARQVGKSTLALQLGIEHYLSLDDIATYQSAKTDPKGFVLSLPDPVIIDEVQRVPELFVAIKEQIDLDRRAGRFVLTGSSNLQGFKQLSDSLAGRIGIIDLYALNLSELWQTKYNVLEQLFADDMLQTTATYPNVSENVLLGGFPEVQKMPDAKTRLLWFTSYIRTYIERDVHDISNIRNLDHFMRLYLSLALRSSQQLNKADLSKDCLIDAKTLDNYLMILRNTYQIQLLAPYFHNALKRLVKMPKLYMLDSGILCHLLKISDTRQLLNSQHKGAIVETFVFTELIKANTYTERPVDLNYYRSSDGKEIDFILDNGMEKVALEVKTAFSVSANDFKPMRYFISQHPQPIKRGIVLYLGERPLPFGEHEGTPLWAMPLGALTGEDGSN